MKKIELIRKLEAYPIFNLKIFREIIRKDRNYAKLALYRLKNEGLVFEIEKDKYSASRDTMIIASNIIWPSYISCWTALRYHNLTEQLPQKIFVITTRARKKRVLILNNSQIIFIRIKPRFFFGYKKEHYNGFGIFVAEKEKAIIDSALLKRTSFSEISGIVKNNIKEININLVIEHLKKIKNISLIKRFGFLLDTLGIDKYNELKRLIGYNYVPLDYAVSKKGRKNKKWKVIENVKL